MIVLSLLCYDWEYSLNTQMMHLSYRSNSSLT